MNILCGYRDIINQNEALLTNICSHGFTAVIESSNFVDGLGGVVWDGSILLCYLLDSIDVHTLQSMRILEFGCGAGLCGLLAAKIGADVILTDRVTDLVEMNTQSIKQTSRIPLNISIIPLDWSDQSSYEHDFGNLDLILGAEIACLLQQQDYLLSLIDSLCLSSSRSVILLTFDGLSNTHPMSKYEAAILDKFKSRGYFSNVIIEGRIVWHKSIPNDISNSEFLQHNPLPPPPPHTSRRVYCTLQPIGTEQLRPNMDTGDTTQFQHIIAFYRPSAGNTCSRCHSHFLHVVNSPVACRHHSGFYVCRKHPCETRCSIDGYGDGLGYYGNGQEDWEAKFWDCCGSEDKNAPGCVAAPHVPY